MKKNNLILLLLFVILGSAAYYFIKTKDNSTSRNSDNWDMQFSIPDIKKISRIFILDRQGRKAQLDLHKGKWLFNGQHPARLDGIRTLLETLQKLTVKFIPTNAAVPGMMQDLATNGIRVEVFDGDGKSLKAFYVGGVTADDRGTYMIMEGSKQPYVMHLPYFEGTLRTRFMVREDDWRDRSIFAEKPEEIEQISIEYPQYQSMSFHMTKVKKGEYQVAPFYPNQPVDRRPLVKGKPESILLLFEKLGAEGIENSSRLKDSVVTNLVPFASILLKTAGSEDRRLRIYPIYPRDQNGQFMIPNDPVPFNGQIQNYFALLEPSNDFYVINHSVFGPIFATYPWFFAPLNKQFKN